MSGSRGKSEAEGTTAAKTARRETKDLEPQEAALERTLAGSRRLGAQSLTTTTRGEAPTTGDRGLVTLQPPITLVAAASPPTTVTPATPSKSVEPAAAETESQHQLVAVVVVSRVNLLGRQQMLSQVFLFLEPQVPQLQRQLK